MWGPEATYGPLGLNSSKSSNPKKYIDLGIWGLAAIFLSHLSAKGFIKFRTVAPIFTNRGSFYPESSGESNQISKS